MGCHTSSLWEVYTTRRSSSAGAKGGGPLWDPPAEQPDSRRAAAVRIPAAGNSFIGAPPHSALGFCPIIAQNREGFHLFRHKKAVRDKKAQNRPLFFCAVVEYNKITNRIQENLKDFMENDEGGNEHETRIVSAPGRVPVSVSGCLWRRRRRLHRGERRPGGLRQRLWRKPDPHPADHSGGPGHDPGGTGQKGHRGVQRQDLLWRGQLQPRQECSAPIH